MRRWAGAAALLVALASAPVAAASDPAAVYNDFARDRVLSCNHSRADLRAVLSDATLNQYGDPYTLVALKLAVRKQLAGGCRGLSAAPAEKSARDAESTRDRTMLMLGAGAVLLTLAVGGWAARRALQGKQ